MNDLHILLGLLVINLSLFFFNLTITLRRRGIKEADGVITVDIKPNDETDISLHIDDFADKLKPGGYVILEVRQK